MSSAQALPPLDDPLRRLPWLAPLSILAWTLLLAGFSVLLRQSQPLPEPRPIDARIIEIPVGGVQSGPTAQAPAAPEKPVRREMTLPKPVPKVVPRKAKENKPPPPPETSNEGAESATATSPSTGASDGRAASPLGTGGVSGAGSDREGARATYAPVPKIPDELREEVFQAEAMARFNVSYDGTVSVTLTKPTQNPRLNQIVLDTLKQWRFVPAVRGGVAIDSVFEVRIPITVQ
jgi:protein TonB